MITQRISLTRIIAVNWYGFRQIAIDRLDRATRRLRHRLRRHARPRHHVHPADRHLRVRHVDERLPAAEVVVEDVGHHADHAHP